MDIPRQYGSLSKIGRRESSRCAGFLHMDIRASMNTNMADAERSTFQKSDKPSKKWEVPEKMVET